jgi:hypothetical protein
MSLLKGKVPTNVGYADTTEFPLVCFCRIQNTEVSGTPNWQRVLKRCERKEGGQY